MVSNKSLRNVQWLDVTLFIFLLTLFQILVYGSVVMMMHMHFILCVKFIMLIVAYGYSYWILKHCSEIIFFTFRKISKRNELMMNPKVTSELSLPPHGSTSDPCIVKVHPLIPCSYLDTFVIDGRCEYLDKYNSVPVLDGRDGKFRYEIIKPNMDSEMIYNLFIKIISCTALFVETFALYVETLYMIIFTDTLSCTSSITVDHFNQTDHTANISDDYEPQLNEIIILVHTQGRTGT